MKKFDILNQISNIGVVAVVRGNSKEQAIKIADACIAGGVTCIELTYTVPGARAIIEALVEKYADNKEVVIGAGSVLDPETCKGAIEAGAKFIVAPSFNENVAKLANRYQIPYVPGTQTIKEIVTAMEFGSDVIKVFPGDILGPRFVKDVKGPLPYANLMPSGGVDIDNIKDWVKAGVVAVSAGSSLTAGAKKNDYALVTETAKKFIAEYKAAKESK
ncbi:MAG: bifunctional 2-keto-4-hydroxyglutarate aldolase/2-keto-3-deoxy-6-phosphogluconate aldolase [Acholeplasmatales bacterium]|nr:bifunctional 2-keto-4-hydroxyglutarate aldolase/2-keto-3-deoxy-6-phosphogluconate aldolase [Acholeplasmatales bacterium]